MCMGEAKIEPAMPMSGFHFSGNSSYGKLYINKSRHTTTTVVKIADAYKEVQNRHFVNATMISDNLVECQHKNKKELQDQVYLIAAFLLQVCYFFLVKISEK